jgi:cardiolipin synthase
VTFKVLLANLTLANQLTFLRLVAIPFFIISVLQGRFGVALILFIGAALTDLLDGLTARILRQGTPLGAYLDPAADKLLLTSAFILLTEYPSMLQQVEMAVRIPIWLTILTIFRDVLIVGVALTLYLAYGQTRFRPSIWGKLTTVAESLTVAVVLLLNFIGREHRTFDVMLWLTLGLTLLSGFHYLAITMRSAGQTKPTQIEDGDR